MEHRLFSFISSNWRGEPLRDYETIVQLIAGTTTAKGLEGPLPPGPAQVPRRAQGELTAEMASVNLKPQSFHGEWNYVIHPRPHVSCKCYLLTHT